MKECLVEIAHPIAVIYWEAVRTHQWPGNWKKEKHVIMDKVPVPLSMDDLRGLGLTPFFSKGLEAILIAWIWPVVEPYITEAQLGGFKGCGVMHYLAQLIEGIDDWKGCSAAVIATTVDMAKAFSRICHNRLITICHDIGIPICAVRLLCSYLDNRSMRVHRNGAISDEFPLPGGGPQRALLTGILYNLYSNWPGFDPANRFSLEQVPVTVPRSRVQQSRGCPPAYFPPHQHLGAHTCTYNPPFVHALPERQTVQPDTCSSQRTVELNTVTT